MAQRENIEYIKKYINYLARKGISIEKVYLYGSYAKEQHHQGSDIDVLLVDSKFDQANHDKLVGKIWRLTYLFDPAIEPYTVGSSKFAEDESSALLDIVKQEGVEIMA